MNISVIGLGRMGAAIAQRLHNGEHSIIGYDPNEETRKAVEQKGITTVEILADTAIDTHVFWLMVPAGKIVDSVINDLLPHLTTNDIVIDGGNSNFLDSQRRAQLLEKKQVHFIDCGTSGGVHGETIGFSLMIGGQKEVYQKIESIFKTIAAPNGYGLVGPSGAGHYVKMVHNGIEYALLQAYAEGCHLIKQGSFKQEDIDLEHVTNIWSNGSIIRSWILELAHGIFTKDQRFKTVSGHVAESGTGKWTVEDAKKHNIPVRLIEESLKIRGESRTTGGNYGTKIVAMLRKAFGGHAVKQSFDTPHDVRHSE